jgi:tRNA dimethylallyltransferase
MREVLFLVGPTASGKTAVALELAPIIPVEIISLDSMNVYRGMDVGTAKPTLAQRERVPHHLVDLVDPNESFSVGRYATEAQRIMSEITRRGKYPLFVGGTPLYLKVMTSGLFSGPSADWELRGTLHQRAENEGTPALHEELRRVDPVSAETIHPNDLKRIVRALEVFHKTGRPISELRTEWSNPRTDRHSLIAGIARDRHELYRRIEKRVDEMFAAGLVEEVQELLAKFGTLGREASQALGYKEVLAYLAGEGDLESTMELVKRNTRRMAKRQLTWFRSFDNIRWFTMGRRTEGEAVAREIAESFATELEGLSGKRSDFPLEHSADADSVTGQKG